MRLAALWVWCGIHKDMENKKDIQERWVPKWEAHPESVAMSLDELRRDEGREVGGEWVGSAAIGESASDISAERLPWRGMCERVNDDESAAKEGGYVDERKGSDKAFHEDESTEESQDKFDKMCPSGDMEVKWKPATAREYGEMQLTRSTPKMSGDRQKDGSEKVAFRSRNEEWLNIEKQRCDSCKGIEDEMDESEERRSGQGCGEDRQPCNMRGA